MSRFELSKQELTYILNRYSDYIDNLDIDNFISSIKSDISMIEVNKEDSMIHDVMQLLVDECGQQIVNDIVLSQDNTYSLYAGVIFDNHVDITKDQISDLEFSTAVFTNGVTVYSQVLPEYALSYSKMDGIVDLTRVKTLGNLNLLYKFNNASCTVKLSTALKTISSKSFKHIAQTSVEYDGTVEEFSELISVHWAMWPPRLRAELKESLEYREILCSDGVWEYSAWRNR